MSSSETRGDPIIIRNAKQDPSYCPYCMRCSGLVRMRKVEDFYWRCRCGAEHDERANVAAPATPSTGRERETELEPLRSHYRMALEDVPGKAAHRAIAAYVDALEAALATHTPSPSPDAGATALREAAKWVCEVVVPHPWDFQAVENAVAALRAALGGDA